MGGGAKEGTMVGDRWSRRHGDSFERSAEARREPCDLEWTNRREVEARISWRPIRHQRESQARSVRTSREFSLGHSLSLKELGSVCRASAVVPMPASVAPTAPPTARRRDRARPRRRPPRPTAAAVVVAARAAFDATRTRDDDARATPATHTARSGVTTAGLVAPRAVSRVRPAAPLLANTAYLLVGVPLTASPGGAV